MQKLVSSKKYLKTTLTNLSYINSCDILSMIIVLAYVDSRIIILLYYHILLYVAV